MRAGRRLAALVRALPTVAISRCWGWVARRRRPRWLVRWLIRRYALGLRFDLSESASALEAFSTLEELFTRRLRQGLRPVDAAACALVSPVDGRAGACGVVEGGTLLQVKGRTYRLAELLADTDAAGGLEGGTYATLYLAPPDYHRVHAPMDAVVTEVRVLPGRLLSVFPEALRSIDGVLAKNERVVIHLETSWGKAVVVMVGAMLVGRMTVHHAPGQRVQRGDEIGVFSLGSTVVLLAAPGCAALDGFVSEGDLVRVGRRIGTLGGGNAS